MKNLRRIREHGFKDAIKEIKKIIEKIDVKGTSRQNIGWHNCLVQLDREITTLTERSKDE